MNIRKCALVCALVLAPIAHAQEEKPAYGITFSGFVKTDVMFDSRQTIAFREGHFLLYPSNIVNDKFNVDINAKDNFNILSIQTRILGKITGPDALGAKTSGLIEGEFFGTSDADVSGFRIRHAYLKMDWASSSLLIGQFWHPMFVVEMFPGVVSFNTGAPFQPFSRNPQIRFSYNINKVKLIAAAISQRDFQSNGPGGFSSAYLRNAVLPNLHAQLQYGSSGTLIGCGLDYKMLIPRLVTTRNVATDASVSSTALLGYAKLVLDPVAVKIEGTYGGNLSDMLMLGGYAVKSIDAVSGIEEYLALKCYSFWGEISTGKDLELALFAGYSKNCGASDNLTGTYYGRGTDIDAIFRISPRVAWNVGKVRFASEFEYTSAGYGSPNSMNKGRVENVKNVANARLLLAAYYFF
jgi:hypothetical protein